MPYERAHDFKNNTMINQRAPVYFEQMEDGFYCSVDGECEYFKSHFEMYIFAENEGRELYEITPENESTLRDSGAFDRANNE